MNAAIATVIGTWLVDLDEEVLVTQLDEKVTPETVQVELPRVIAAARSGSTIVAVVDRRPPLAISHDAGRTWRESGGGLPKGTAVAVDADNPDRILYGARNRLFLSTDGGRFWRALVLELPEITAVAFA